MREMEENEKGGGKGEKKGKWGNNSREKSVKLKGNRAERVVAQPSSLERNRKSQIVKRGFLRAPAEGRNGRGRSSGEETGEGVWEIKRVQGKKESRKRGGDKTSEERGGKKLASKRDALQASGGRSPLYENGERRGQTGSRERTREGLFLRSQGGGIGEAFI